MSNDTKAQGVPSAEELRRSADYLRAFSGGASHEYLQNLNVVLAAIQSRPQQAARGVTDWRAHALHIHNVVAKRWLAWSDEDRRYLALAMSGEVGELLNLIKKDWRGDDGDRREHITEEFCDIRIYLELLAKAYGVDLDAACIEKLPELYRRWPEAVKGAPIAPLLAPSPDAQAVASPELLAALRNQSQCDEDGVMCIVSRQAVDEAIDLLSAPKAHDAVLTDDIFDIARDAFHDAHDGDNFDASLRHAIEAALACTGATAEPR